MRPITIVTNRGDRILHHRRNIHPDEEKKKKKKKKKKSMEKIEITGPGAETEEVVCEENGRPGISIRSAISIRPPC